MAGPSPASTTTAWVEAATYHDVAGAIITGAGARKTVFSGDPAVADTYPAIDDPKSRRQRPRPGLPDAAPGHARGAVLQQQPTVTPNVIAQDEASKDAIAATMFATAAPAGGSRRSRSRSTYPCCDARRRRQPELRPGDRRRHVQLLLWPRGREGGGTVVLPGGATARLCDPRVRARHQPRANHSLEEADAIAWSYEYVGQHGFPSVSTRVLPPDCSSP